MWIKSDQMIPIFMHKLGIVWQIKDGILAGVQSPKPLNVSTMENEVLQCGKTG